MRCDRGGANHRIKGVILMDALYGDEDKFAAWVAARRRQAFLLSAYTDSTKDENATLQGLLDKRRVPYAKAPAAGPESRAPWPSRRAAGSTCMAILLRAPGGPIP